MINARLLSTKHFLIFLSCPLYHCCPRKINDLNAPPALAHEGTGRFCLNFTRKKVAVCSVLLRALLTFFEFSSKPD